MPVYPVKRCRTCKKLLHLTHFQTHSKHKKKQATQKCYLCRKRCPQPSRVQECRKLWESWKRDSKCLRCGEDDPQVLQADHYKGKKVKELSNYIWWASHGGVAAQKEEFQKVRCFCRFCHDMETRKDFHGMKQQRRDTKKSRWEDRHKALKVEYVMQEKLRRGQCLLCERKVERETSNCFKFDHGLNHKLKSFSISYYVNQNRCTFETAKPRLQREMQLCRLLCGNCDWRSTKKELWGHEMPVPWQKEEEAFWNF